MTTSVIITEGLPEGDDMELVPVRKKVNTALVAPHIRNLQIIFAIKFEREICFCSPEIPTEVLLILGHYIKRINLDNFIEKFGEARMMTCDFKIFLKEFLLEYCL